MPYPAPARSTLTDRSSLLSQIYQHPSDAAYFFEALRQVWLKDWCREHQLDLLDLDPPAPDNPLTPDHLLAADRFHMAPRLSDIMLIRIHRWLA